MAFSSTRRRTMVRREVEKMTNWCKKRYPSTGYLFFNSLFAQKNKGKTVLMGRTLPPYQYRCTNVYALLSSFKKSRLMRMVQKSPFLSPKAYLRYVDGVKKGIYALLSSILGNPVVPYSLHIVVFFQHINEPFHFLNGFFIG